MNRSVLLIPILAISGFALSPAVAEQPSELQTAQWLDWRGPNADGTVTASSRPPTEWDAESGKNIAWSVPLHGLGHSTPIVVDGQVWITAATLDGKKQSVVSVDLESGEKLVDRVLFVNAKPDPLSNDVNNYAAPSCVAEPGRVYVHFGSYGTAAIDTATKKVLWERRDLECNHWRGPGSSPILFGDLLILSFDGADVQYMAGLNKNTGETIWKTERSTPWDDLDKNGKPSSDGDFRKAFSTPIIAEVGGQTQMISVASKCFFGYDPLTGKELWQHFHSAGHTGSARPLFKDGVAYLNTGYSKAQLWALRIDGQTKGEVSSDAVIWKRTKNIPNRGTPVLIGNRIYAVDDGGIATCLDPATGDDLWRERVKSTYSASTVCAGGNLYFLNLKGHTTVVKQSDTFEVVAENSLERGEHDCGASIAVVGNSLLIRTGGFLYRIAE